MFLKVMEGALVFFVFAFTLINGWAAAHYVTDRTEQDLPFIISLTLGVIAYILVAAVGLYVTLILSQHFKFFSG
jgi:hypothetical protein